MVVVLVLLVAAFAAGWIARGSDAAEAEAVADEPAAPSAGPRRRFGRRARAGAEPTPASPAAPRAAASRPSAAPRADPVADAARALSLASAAYETAVDRWLDERDAVTPAGRAAVGEVERAAQRLDAASARLDEMDHPLADAAWDALDALREAARLLDAFRRGTALDAESSRALDHIDDELAQARAAFAEAAA